MLALHISSPMRRGSVINKHDSFGGQNLHKPRHIIKSQVKKAFVSRKQLTSQRFSGHCSPP